jgi:hypothetical protein
MKKALKKEPRKIENLLGNRVLRKAVVLPGQPGFMLRQLGFK